MPLSVSSAASIQIWVDNISTDTSSTGAGHPRMFTFDDQENEHSHRPALNKRKRGDCSALPRKAARRALTSMSGNEEPRRSQRLAPGVSATDLDSGADEGGAAVEVTPRPSRRRVLVTSTSRTARNSGRDNNNTVSRPRPAPPVFLPRELATPALSNSAPSESPTRSETSRSSTSTLSSTTTGRKRREKSPVKNTTNLRITQRPVRFVLPYPHTALPPQVAVLHARLKSIKKGQRIIPEGIVDQLNSVLQADHGDNADEIDAADVYHDPRDAYALRRELDDITDIVQAALLAKHKHGTESSWNCTVHAPLFQAALRTIPGIHFHDVTTVQPDPVFLPTHQGSGIILQSKLVDYTFNLEPLPTEIDRGGFEGRIERLFRVLSPSEQSMTQTTYDVTLMRPAAVSIETKGDKGTDNEAKTQLGLWVATHFNKMDSLLSAAQRGRDGNAGMAGPTEDVPFHPIIVANPDKIAIMYAVPRADEGNGDGEAEEGPKPIDIYSGPEMPTPVTHVDAYRCLQTLRCLAEWADTQYREWIERNLLG